MKKIYFDDNSNIKKNWLKSSFLILSLVFIIFGTFTEIFSEDWNKRIKAFGFLLFSIYFLRKVIRKNYIQWNKIGMTVRINSYFGEKKISFNKVNSYTFKNDTLKIFQSNKTIILDLSSVLESDKKRLIQIIDENTKGNFKQI